MEFLVTMTTTVPEGTSAEAVDAVRTREAERARALAADGVLLRLWRPPLAPGEWRTLGLFAARDGTVLETVLASMPLRVWRRDEVTPLGQHPHDPEQAGCDSSGQEYFTTLTVAFPPEMPKATAAREFELEGDHSRELAAAGKLRRLWRLAPVDGASRGLGLWCARDEDEMRRIVESLPLRPWMQVDTTPLTPHPNDPHVAAVGIR